MGYTTDEMFKLFNYFSKSVMAISPKDIFNGMKEVRGISGDKNKEWEFKIYTI